MNRRAVAIRVLCERKLAKQFRQATKDMKAAQVGLHLKSVIAAALMNPDFIVSSMTKSRALALQYGTNRVALRPVLLPIPCSDKGERESIRRLVQALTWQVAALMNGTVLPDESSVVRALLGAWLKITVLNSASKRRQDAGEQPVIDPASRWETRSLRKRKKSRSTKTDRSRRRKAYQWAPDSLRATPHPRFPEVAAQPVDWEPGRKGRPPRGAKQNKNGSWRVPRGFRIIDGRVHPPLEHLRDAVSVRQILPKVGEQNRRRRAKKVVQERIAPKEIASEAETLAQSTPDAAESTFTEVSAEQPPGDQTAETPPGKPPSAQPDCERPESPPLQGQET
ncbi:MAG TPA: hypothetical protein PLF37_13285 [Planctomycetota bacterium]|nr:hypothetical protein [Planctomycetota bacterium]